MIRFEASIFRVIGFTYIDGFICYSMKTDTQVDQYLSQFSGEPLLRLHQIRALIHECATDAEEHFAYGMPAYRLNKSRCCTLQGLNTIPGFTLLLLVTVRFKNA